MTLKKYPVLTLCFLILTAFTIESKGQEQRSRIVRPSESQPTTTTTSSPNQVKRTILSSPTTKPVQRPTLDNEIIVVGAQKNPEPLVKKTNSSQPTSPVISSSNKAAYSSGLVSRMLSSIQTKFGIPYRMGTTGPNRYDCSGFVWSVFNESGVYFERSSAKTYWLEFEPVYGEDRYKFGTLVFFNRLGHVGIVADEKGFYHASSSKGITYSPFAGYWEKRVVGFRRIPAS